MARDMSAEVQGYLGLCEALAVTLARPGTRGVNGVEFDDLVQEGLINVWQSLQRGVTPRKDLVKGRMVNFQKWLGRSSNIPYEQALSIEDMRFAELSRDATTTTLYATPKEEGDGADPITFLGEVQGD